MSTWQNILLLLTTIDEYMTKYIIITDYYWWVHDKNWVHHFKIESEKEEK